jgi:FkbM family methyltransferase
MKISLITACKNRVDALKISLMSWLNFEEIHEIIITDWNSDDPINYLTEIDPRIKVIRVSDKQYFNQPNPLNLAAKIATGDYIIKVDADHIFNSYYNGIKKYFPKDDEFTCGSLNFSNPEYYDENTKEYYVDNSYFFTSENRKKYVYAYSPIFRYLVGILFVKKEHFDAVGGYNENFGDCYAFEDEEICNRLELYGLKKRHLEMDFYFIHLPHPDKKRTENFKGFESQDEYEQKIRENLSSAYDGDELEWQVEYALSEKHVNVNKDRFSKITNYYTEPKSHWNITQLNDQNYYAVEIEDKANNIMDEFPSVYCVSLEECQERRHELTFQFNNYGIEPIFLISKRYSESNDKVVGKYLHTLNDGTKGCCVSHLKMIKEWYNNTDEEYAFFCEDDLSLETIDYWDFTWNEFIEKIPDDAECVQLLTIRNHYDTFEMRSRYWDDWGATAYILTRNGAKKIIDSYIFEDVYSLEVPNKEIMPLIENIIFSFVNTYTIPLFVENVSFKSTFENQDDDVKEGQKNNHKIAYDIVLNMWKSKKQVLKSEIVVVEKTELEKLLELYSLDTENPEHNFNLGLWYETQGHTAPALSYFLRCAERGFELDPDLAYEALIRGSSCYFKQGTRDGSGRGMLWQAQMFLPNRPEAYYLLARYAAKNEWWQDCYSTSELCLLNCDFDLSPLRTDVEYPGKYGLLFQKAISGWWWGKVEESRSIFFEMLNSYNLSEGDRWTIIDNLKKMGVSDIEYDNSNNKTVDFVYPDNFNWSDLSYEDIITIQREVVCEKVYRFWEDIKEGDTVLDIGASVGAYTISIMNQNPKKVYCVEPSKKLLNVLLENCSSGSEDLITAINYGIVDCVDDKINIFGGEDEFSPITFKTMVDQYKIDHINYMKVDCEGGEYSIFKDENMEFLKNKVDFIAMEMHLNYSECREKFKQFRDNYLTQFENYKVVSCTRQNISWGNSIDLKDKIFDNNFIDNYSCEFMIYIKNR